MSNIKMPNLKEGFKAEKISEAKELNEIDKRDKELESKETLPTFPMEVLPPFVSEYCEELEKTGLNAEVLANVSLSILSSLAGSKTVDVNGAGWTEPIITQILTVGDASTKKTAAARPLIKPLEAEKNRDISRHKESLSAYNELEPEEKKKNRKPKQKLSLINDFSIEALQSTVPYQEAPYFILKDEIAPFYDRAARSFDGKGQAAFLSFYSGVANTTLTVDSNRGAESCENAMMYSMYGGTQTEKMDVFFHDENIKNGFCTRFLAHYVEKPKEFVPKKRYKMSRSFMDNYQIGIDHLIYRREGRSFIDLSDDAADYHHELINVYGSLAHNEVDKTLSVYLGKQAGTVARISGVLAYVRDSNQITIDDVMDAEKVVNYYYEHYRKLVRISSLGAFTLPHKLEKRRVYIKSINNMLFNSNSEFEKHFINSGAGKIATFYRFKEEMLNSGLINVSEGKIRVTLI